MPWDSHGGPHAVIDGVEAEDLWVRRPGYDSRKCALLRRCVAALISTWCAMAWHLLLPPHSRRRHPVIMFLVTACTNLSMLPCVRMLHRTGRYWEASVGAFTCFTSFMYHTADSLHQRLWLSEGMWHRLDNVGSIVGMGILCLYFASITDPAAWAYANFGYLALVLVLQEVAPWDERFTFGPILLCAAYLLLRLATDAPASRPAVHWPNLRRGLALLAVAFAFFVRALDDEHDAYRVRHGCWHLFVGAAAYFLWQGLRIDYRAEGTMARTLNCQSKKALNP